MRRWQAVTGLGGSALMVLSSAAHGILGWNQLRGALTAAKVPAELLLGVQLGWQFGGVAMLAFGVITGWLFARRLHGHAVTRIPAGVAGTAYLGFGAWALVASGFDPFFLAFIVPAVLLLAASLPLRRGAGDGPAPSGTEE